MLHDPTLSFSWPSSEFPACLDSSADRILPSREESKMSRLARWILSLLSLSACCAGAQVVNFDDVPDGTDISRHYPGLTFSCSGSHCASRSIFARQTQDPLSPPNVVAPQQTGPGEPAVHNQTTGTIKIAIACSATKVTIQARSIQVPEPLNLVQHAILWAKDTNVNDLGQAVGTQYDQWEPLTVSSPNTPIKVVFLGVEGTGVGAFAQFDNLTVECAPRTSLGWKPVLGLASVLLLGLVVFAIRQRLKRP